MVEGWRGVKRKTENVQRVKESVIRILTSIQRRARKEKRKSYIFVLVLRFWARLSSKGLQ